MKVLLFGGKFNPLHEGHIQSIKQVIFQKNFDEVWLIPSFLKLSAKCMNESSRIKIINDLVLKLNNFKLVDFELKAQKYVPTIKTLEYLTKKYQHNFTFLIGSDNVDEFHEWDDAKKLINLAKFLVVTRKGRVENKKNTIDFNMEKIKINAPRASSTKIRKGDFTHLNKQTINILNKDILFLKTIMQNLVSHQRFQHCLNVAKMATKLAKIYCPRKTKKAYITGLLHDVTKEQSIKPKFKFQQNEPQQVWHQWSGANFVKNKLKIQDLEIINAIAKHTTAQLEMSVFDKIIYCADKISIDRKYKNVLKLRKICFDNLDKGFCSVFKNQYNFLKTQIQPSLRTIKIANKWLSVKNSNE